MKIGTKIKTEIYFGASFLINILSWFNIYFKIPKENFPFLIHYRSFSSIEIFGNFEDLFIVSLIGLIIFIINAILSNVLLKKKEEFYALLISFLTFFIQILVIIYSFILVSINTL
ncbi:MAG TPA: hypothetical protein PLA57_02090 [Candidatus Paceibacterota bacterium]|jgi:hypothetical protein|nr:hypothetical protein [Candidatus Paceibacterota bacterium]HRS47778.1 hypothetical protein [Candidatus Paceibacterota bacterium]